jgi:hypothetical protein
MNSIIERKRKQNDNFSDSQLKFDIKHSNDDISWDDYRKMEINGE